MFEKKTSFACVPCVLHVLFFEFFVGFWVLHTFWLWHAGKNGRLGPAAEAGEEGEQEATNAAFRPRWREQLWGQGGEREFFL